MSELRPAVKAYLDAIAQVSAVGTPEQSHYPALDNLFNAVGAQLKPKVRAVVHPSGAGEGQPDLGFFSADNPQPDRGVVEVKAADADLDELIHSEQVQKYWAEHRLVLCTNLREFALVGQDGGGAPAVLERYCLADTSVAFEKLLTRRGAAANRHGESLGEYLLRVLSHRSTIAEPRDLARLLASYARDALQRVEQTAADGDSLKLLRESIEQALSMSFESADGGKFFRSTLVQTLFYGVFAAWVLWARAGAAGAFDWRQSAQHLETPVLGIIFHHLLTPGLLQQLELEEVLDWTEAALARVDQKGFLTRFGEGEAVQYFYEPFLEAFDPQLRKDLGVWYTPREIVRYMVARVDRALRDDLGIEKGLADERVYVLDPCCGTGAYLVETLRRIAETEQASGGGATWAAAVQQAAATRIFGFEIMPAPLVVAHLEIGLALEQMGAPLPDNQRAGVYLTNALTGWEPHQTEPLPFPALEQERRDANRVKQQRPILVVLGNPPYNGFPGVSEQGEERELSDSYREVEGTDVPKPQGQGLNDLYVRFFRMAERRIAEQTGKGIVCFISNYSWLDGLSFPGMRQRYLDAFDIIRIDNLNGDKYRTGKRTPDGKPDPSVFSTKDDPVGIQVGTAIATLVRKDQHEAASAVEWRELWGIGKLQELDAQAETDPSVLYRLVKPEAGLGLPFTPAAISAQWFDWPSLVDLFPAYFPGVKTGRDSFLTDIDQQPLRDRIREYFDSNVSHADLTERWPASMRTSKSFPGDGPSVRSTSISRSESSGRYFPYAYRPLDRRWLYWFPDTGLLARPTPDLIPHVFSKNVFLVLQTKARPDLSPPLVSSHLGDLNQMNSGNYCIPLWLRDDMLGEEVDGIKQVANLSERAQSYIDALHVEPVDLFYHVLATLHDPVYQHTHADTLRAEGPRIPLPDERADLLRSAARGRRLARLLDTESNVSGELDTSMAVPSTIDDSPMQGDDFQLTAGWGHFGAKQAVMPGQGKTVCRKTKQGNRVVDVYLNGRAYWRDIPLEVWEYRLGGYQVLKKWLSYRESKVLGRALKLEEVQWFAEMARRIAAVLALA